VGEPRYLRVVDNADVHLCWRQKAAMPIYVPNLSQQACNCCYDKNGTLLPFQASISSSFKRIFRHATKRKRTRDRISQAMSGTVDGSGVVVAGGCAQIQFPYYVLEGCGGWVRSAFRNSLMKCLASFLG